MDKFFYRLKCCWKITKRDTLSPFFEKQQFFQILTIPIFLLLAFMAGDLMDNLFNLSQTFAAILLTIPIWFAINFILSPFRMLKEEKELGIWIGKQFVFHEAKLIKTLVIHPEENEKKVDIALPGIPKDTYVAYKIEYDGGICKIQFGSFMSRWDWIDREKQSGWCTYKAKMTVLLHCPDNSDQTIVRIYIKSWKYNDKQTRQQKT